MKTLKIILFTLLISSLIFLCGVIVSADEEVTREMTDSDGISTLLIYSDKTIDEINSSKDVKGKGTYSLLDKDGGSVASGDLESIKGRGSTSWTMQVDKLPYNIKLDKKAELISGAGKATKWCLISGDMYVGAHWIRYNPTLDNMFAYSLYKELGGTYAIEYLPIDLYVNDEYRGVYLLTEAIEIGESRININANKYDVEGEEFVADYMEWNDGSIRYTYAPDSVLKKNGGMIVEMGNYGDDVECGFMTTYGNKYLFKEPECPTEEQCKTMAVCIQKFEDTLYSDTGYDSLGKHYSDYIDLDSFVKVLCVDCVTAQGDAMKKSCFYYIDVDENGELTGKLYAGPAWDYDGAYFASYTVGDNTVSNNIMQQVFKHGDVVNMLREFSEGKLKDIWTRYISEGGDIETWIDMLTLPETYSFMKWSEGIDFNAGQDNNRSSEMFLSFVKARYNKWYNSVWVPTALQGVTFDFNVEDATAIINAFPAEGSYSKKICKVDEETGKIEKYVDLITEPGIYEIMVTNRVDSALSYVVNPYSDSVIANERTGITMFSNPLVITEDMLSKYLFGFTDISLTSWYYPGFKYVFEHEYMVGTSKGIFSPNMSLTRAQAVQILAKVSGDDLSEYTDSYSFDDVGDRWYHNAIEWAYDKKITSGTGEGVFSPDEVLSREQLCVMLYAFAEYLNYDVSNTISLDEYEDASNISTWAYDAVAWSVSEGFISGTSATKLSPETPSSRAQTALIIKNFCEKVIAE